MNGNWTVAQLKAELRKRNASTVGKKAALVESFLVIAISPLSFCDEKQPNIVFIMADDLGWNDVSYHGSDQILTPNIDLLAYQGVILDQYYTDCRGTPSRSAVMTGKYPLRLGTQGRSIKATEDRGVSKKQRLLPSYLQDLGYSTHLVGKWELGKSRNHYLPLNRGFDSFFGFLDGSVDYYTYNLIEETNNTQYYGLDLYNGFTPAEGVKGHVTDVLTNRAIEVIKKHNTSSPLYLHLAHAAPHAGGGLVSLQPTVESIDQNKHVAHSARQLYAGLVTHLDSSIGRVVAALADKDMLYDTIIIFVSDNGAATVGSTQNFGSNAPLRGLKSTPWEGGVKVPAFIWYPELNATSWTGLFHVTDWLPTLLSAAGGVCSNSSMDGFNQWDAIANNQPSTRKDILLSFDDFNGWAALRDGDFKIIVGDLNEQQSAFHGRNLTDLRLDPPEYESALLNCKVAKVLKEHFDYEVDIDEAFIIRNVTSLDPGTNISNAKLCIPTKEKGCLFNLREDPLELNDLWNSTPEVVKHLTLRLRTLWAKIKPRNHPTVDKKCNPALFDYTWSPWLANNASGPERLKVNLTFPLQVTREELQYLVDLNLKSFKDTVVDYVQNMGNSFIKSVGSLFSL